MGATTLYHPVGLHVIRGAAQYAGFEFGKIKQLKADPEAGTALYNATIQVVPHELAFTPLWQIWARLSSSFMDDIMVSKIGYSKSGVLTCWLDVNIKQVNDVELEAAELDSTAL